MTEIRIPEQPGIVNLGNGMALHSRGLAGSVHVATAGGSRDISGGALSLQLSQAGLRPGPLLSASTGSAAPSLTRSRTLTPDAGVAPTDVTIEIEVADGEACILLVEDAAGSLSWVIPEEPPAPPVAGVRSLGSTVSFTVPAHALLGAADGTRGFVSGVESTGAKVQAWFFTATDALLGPMIHGFAKKWETQNRPCFVRGFTPADYRIDDPHFTRLTEPEWHELATGPALLFVHGTFSSSAAFQGLKPEVVQTLSDSYGARIFAFNHPTMTTDPRENAVAFLSDMPQGLSLEVDIVCHSRGGLVARQLAALGQVAGRLRVRRIVFVGATNAGTALADDTHMVDMVSRFTTLAKFVPQGAAKTVVDALVLAVKVLGHGLLHDLEGLAAMNPKSAFMLALNVPGTSNTENFAIVSNFEPKTGTPLISLRRAEDLAADRIFGRDDNDLVVPSEGVFASNGAAGFPIAASRVLSYEATDGVVHTGYFDESRTGRKLLDWLAAEQPGSRSLAQQAAAGSTAAEVARMFDAMRDHAVQQLASVGASRGLFGKSDDDFTTAELEKLRPHVVNLSEGTFKASGIYSSTPQDVDTIVREHIPRFAEALPVGQKLRVVVWAHGGLIGERDGLRIAQKHIDWWLSNGVFPIYFVWETGLFDALRSILEQVRRKIPGLGGRDLFDYTSDPLLEIGAHALGGVSSWGAMKRNAELSSASSGGARLVAQRLAELATSDDFRRGRELELHAVGHSAGSIFHSWFLPAAKNEQVPAFKTLQLLAPAITVAEFDDRLASQIGAGGTAERAILYTMKRSYEEADNCAGIYRKSLLYLIHHALEPQKRTPILGLELSLRADATSASLFGLNGAPNAAGRVVWSVTDGDGRNSSRSESHGGFDDDAATMNSVAANVLDEPKARVAYVDNSRSLARGVDNWPVSDDWLRGVDTSVSAAPASLPAVIDHRPKAQPTRPASAPIPSGDGGTRGKRRALCIGIDAYPAPNTLSGCVEDTMTWTRALSALGFEVTPPLCNEKATHQAIVDALNALVRSSHAGDTLVFHYSGHGTEVTDFDGDEDTDKDQAMVPVDFDTGAFLIDDDLREIFNQLPAGVDLTCFIDCCHSGTITRMLGRAIDESPLPSDARARFLQRTEHWQDWMRAHERFRQRGQATPALALQGSRTIDNNVMRWVNFSACESHEVAYESNGSGDFTRLATKLLTTDALQRSNRDFQDAVIRAFGERRRQTPKLDCTDAQRDAPLMKFLR